ncbi:MAG TPA: sigma-70 family RNA polymerase sigma factor [Verrucomicrobiae bacterium]
MDDSVLLRQYAENNSAEAFASLVTRHINLVYSVALRQVGNPHNAEEITQAAFIILARKAAQLRHHQALSSWLFQVTRLTANNFVRSEMRRQFREQEAHMQSIFNESDNEAWLKIAPLLDTAVAGLREKDRQVVLMRFYEGKNFREIGSMIGIGEDAAEKRIKRALEKLRKIFAKNGVSSTTAILAGTISANSVQAAPVALAKSVTAVAIAKGAAASASTLTLIKGALKIMAWTKMKTAIVVGVVAILAAGTTTVIVKKVNQSHLSEARAFYDSAMTHYMAREYEAELADLNKAIELNSKFMEALFSRACLYDGNLPMKERDYAKAVADYTRFLEINPRDVSTWHNRALCYEQLHQYDKAIADYTAIIEGNMDFSHLVDGKDKQMALDYHYRGRAYQWYKKDYLKAIADYDEALRLDSMIEMVHQHRGQCYEALGQFEKAKEDYAMEKTK